MKAKLNKALMLDFKKRAGGRDEAVEQIKACLGCSISKAMKLADGRYPSQLSQLERAALASLLETDVDVLYRAVGRPRAEAS